MTKNEERINKLFKELVPETGKADWIYVNTLNTKS